MKKDEKNKKVSLPVFPNTGHRDDIIMFKNLLRIFCNVPPKKLQEAAERDGAANSQENTAKEIRKKTYDNPEIQVLSEHYGDLFPGRKLEISLKEMLTIIPRNRKRSDAYRLLGKRLREQYGVELIVTSKGGQRDEGKNN